MTYTPDQRARIAPRFATPDNIERDVKQTLELPVYLEASLVAPTAGTLTIYSASAGGNDSPILGPFACSVIGDKASYELPAASTTSLPLADDWMESWVLTVEGDPLEFRREAALVRTRLRPVISDSDLERLHTELRAWKAQDRSSYQCYIDAAWDEIQTALMELGRRPYLILSSYALRTAHLKLSLANVFRDYASSAGSDGKYAEMASTYEEQYRDSFKRIQFRYDEDEDGLSGGLKSNVSPTIWTNVPANWTWTTGGSNADGETL